MKIEKYFYQKWWFWFTIVLLICSNFTCLLISDKSLQSSIIAIIGAWVSGIATIFIGVIATRQNKRYKQDSDEHIKKQYDFEVYKQIIEIRTNYVENIKKQLNSFCENFDFAFVTSRLAKLQVLFQENPLMSDTSEPSEILDFQARLKLHYLDLKQAVMDDWNKQEYTETFCKALDKYFSELHVFISTINYKDLPKTIGNINSTMCELQLELMKQKNNVIVQLDVDLNQVLLEKSGDLDFIKKHYNYLNK